MTAGGRNRRWVLFWALFAATLVVYAVMIHWSLPRISAAAGGLVPFDLRPMGYSLDQATALLTALTPEARQFYLGPQHWLDLVYPALLGATLIWATFWAAREARLALRLALILPAILGTAFDWLENARVAVLLQAESVTAEAVQAASFASVTKSLATTLAMLVVLAGLGYRGWRRWKGAAGWL